MEFIPLTTLFMQLPRLQMASSTWAATTITYAGQRYNGCSDLVILTGGDIDSSAAVQNGRVIFGVYDGFVYARDALSGTNLWSRSVSSIAVSPAIAMGLSISGLMPTGYTPLVR